jgi:hypothetical protein
MTTRDNISIAGTLRSTLNRGTTLPGAIKELVDNSIDSGAKLVKIGFNTISNDLIIADDGHGMTKEVADHTYRIHDDKEASTKIGRFGIGKVSAEGYLSGTKSVTTTLTKRDGGRLFEVNADWPVSIAKSEWNPRASGASADFGAPLWETHTVNSSHGTVVKIPMQAELMQTAIDTLGDITCDLDYAYHECGGVEIVVEVDGLVQEMESDKRVGWDDVSVKYRMSMGLVVCTKPGEAASRVFMNIDGGFKRFNYFKENPNGSKVDPVAAALIDDYDATIASGFTCVPMNLRAVYNPEWNPTRENPDDEWKPVHVGFLTFKRQNRHIASFPNEPRTSGDFWKQRVASAIRSSLDYTHEADGLVKTEGDKSRITKENIDRYLLKTVRDAVRKWGAGLCKTLSPSAAKDAAVNNPKSVPRNVVKEFKEKWIADENFRKAWQEVVEADKAKVAH